MEPSIPDELTRFCDAAAAGDELSAQRLVPLLYDELRRLAARRMAKLPPGQTLQPTALVHEVYLRLARENGAHWRGRTYFVRAACVAMRNIVVEAVRHKMSRKRGGDRERRPLHEAEIVVEVPDDEVLAVGEALEILEERDPEKAQIVLLRYFSGFNTEETAELLGISPATVERRWRFIRAWLRHRLSHERSPGDGRLRGPAGSEEGVVD